MYIFTHHLRKKCFKYCYPAGIYLLKVNNENTRTRHKICLKLTIKAPERFHWRGSGVFIVNFEHISHLVLVFLLLALNMSFCVVLLIFNLNYSHCFPRTKKIWCLIWHLNEAQIRTRLSS